MKDPKNADKTMQELKDIVFKNLAKDPIYYTKDGQFGIKDLGYVVDAPGLGEPKEAKGKYKSSGYGDLKESKEAESEKESEEMIDLQSKLMQLGVNAMVVDAIAKSKGIQGLRDRLKEKLKEGEEYYDGDDEEEVKDVRDMSWTKGFTKEEQTLREVIRAMIAEELDIEDYKAKLRALEKPYESNKEDLAAIQKIYTSHIAGLNSIAQNLKEDEVEEAYQLVNINPVKSDKERNEREPQPFKMSYVDPSIVDSLTKNQHLRILRSPSDPENITLAIRARLVPTSAKNIGKTTDNLNKLNLDIPSDLKNFLTDANNISGEKQLPTREGVAELYKVLSNATLNKNGSLVLKVPNPNYEKSPESLKESVEKDLADINKEAEHEVLQNKLAKIDDLIDHKRSKLTKLDEDEDMKALTDKKKVKELEKDIKKLEVARKKVEKMMSKFKGKKAASKEVIDETENDGLDQQTINDITEKYNEIYSEKGTVDDQDMETITSDYDFSLKPAILDYLSGYDPSLEFDM
jgi:hypothetical protein